MTICRLEKHDSTAYGDRTAYPSGAHFVTPFTFPIVFFVLSLPDFFLLRSFIN